MSVNEEMIAKRDEFEEGNNYLIDININGEYNKLTGIYTYTGGNSYKGFSFINLTHKIEITDYLFSFDDYKYVVVYLTNINDNTRIIISKNCRIFKILTNEYVLK
jgi:hypothetical protein